MDYITRQKVESGYSYRDGVWSGGEPNYEKLSANLGIVLHRKLYNRRNEIFQIDPKTKTHQTCNEIRDHAVNFSTYLKHVTEVNAGDVIALCAHNDKYSIILVLSSIYLSLPIICIDPELEQDEINRIVEIVKPTLLVCEKEYLFKFKSLQIKHKLEKNDQFDINYLSSPIREKNFNPESADPTKAIVLYMCTSGFTGPRRIVPYTQSFFYNTIYRMQNIVTRHDILLNILPLCHWGAVWSLLFCLVFGSTNIAVEWSSSMNTLKLIEKFKVTCLNIYTKHLMYICLNPKFENYPHTKKLRLIWSRGKSIPTEQMKFMRSVFQCTHIVNCYACVEFGGCVTHFDPTYEYDMNIMKINSVGRLRRGCEAKIVDIETRKLLGPNQDGELLVKTINMPRKYYSRNIEPDYTEDGWYVTGDYAKFDEEQCLYIVGRIENLLHLKSNLVTAAKTFLVSLGKGDVFINDITRQRTIKSKISPHDIEYIITRMPTVRSCGVVGLPDPVLGELPVAFVVKEPNAVVTEKDIIKTVALEGKDYQRLRGGVHFISQLPSSVVGGISRRELRKLLPTLKPNNSCKCGWI